MLVQKLKVVLIAIDFLLQPLHVLLELVEPVTIQFVVDPLHHQGGQVLLELPLGLLELGGVLLEDVLDAGLHSLYLGFEEVLVLLGRLLEFLCKLRVIVHYCLLQFDDL